MQNNEVRFEIIHMPPENTNSVLVSHGADAVIFDAWGRADDWIKLLDGRGLKLRAIYATHGHSDHISAAPDLATHYDIPWYMNHRDLGLITWGNMLLTFFDMPQIPDNFRRPTDLTDGTYEILSGVKMVAVSAAGHSAGGMIFYFPNFGILLVGDTLFRDGCGRWDLPTGDECTLRKTIEKIKDMNLPDETYVVHGHGVDSTIEILKKSNPYFGGCGHHCCCHHCDGDCGCK